MRVERCQEKEITLSRRFATEGSRETGHWLEGEIRSVGLFKDAYVIMGSKNRCGKERTDFLKLCSWVDKKKLGCSAQEEWLAVDGSTDCLSVILRRKQIPWWSCQFVEGLFSYLLSHAGNLISWNWGWRRI